jgi:hypothetical protein
MNLHWIQVCDAEQSSCVCIAIWILSVTKYEHFEKWRQRCKIFNCNVFHPEVYCQGNMFRPLLGHLQVLWENSSKSYLCFNALWDPKCLQIMLYECEIHKFVYIGICVAVSALKLNSPIQKDWHRPFSLQEHTAMLPRNN